MSNFKRHVLANETERCTSESHAKQAHERNNYCLNHPKIRFFFQKVRSLNLSPQVSWNRKKIHNLREDNTHIWLSETSSCRANTGNGNEPNRIVIFHNFFEVWLSFELLEVLFKILFLFLIFVLTFLHFGLNTWIIFSVFNYSCFCSGFSSCSSKCLGICTWFCFILFGWLLLFTEISISSIWVLWK